MATIATQAAPATPKTASTAPAAKVVPATVQPKAPAPAQYVAVLGPMGYNPKKPGTNAHKRFALYSTGITVAAYKAAVLAQYGAQQAGCCAADLLYDQRHGYVTLHNTAAAATTAAAAAQPAPAKA